MLAVAPRWAAADLYCRDLLQAAECPASAGLTTIEENDSEAQLLERPPAADKHVPLPQPQPASLLSSIRAGATRTVSSRWPQPRHAHLPRTPASQAMPSPGHGLAREAAQHRRSVSQSNTAIRDDERA
jgi:hypothetical protein